MSQVAFTQMFTGHGGKKIVRLWHKALILSLGGAVLEDGDGTDLAQVYNPKTHAWTEVAPMQIARSGSAACTLKGKIYVIGKMDI